MKLTVLHEAPSEGVSLSSIVAYISNKLGGELVQIPGVEHFHNSTGNGYGIRYVLDGTTRCVRFNWNSEAATGNAKAMTSIDIFTGKGHDPDFNIHPKGLSIISALPTVVHAIQSPHVGRDFAFPVNPAEALEEPVTEGRQAKTTDEKIAELEAAIIEKRESMRAYKGSQGRYISAPSFSHAEISNTIASMQQKLNKLKRSKKNEEKLTSEGFVLVAEASRNDFSAMAALDDFLHQLSNGKSYTRSEFVGRYHIVNAGIFDTAFNDFKDKFLVKGTRLALPADASLDSLKDSIMSKAGVVEITKGGSDETYFKTGQEEELEEEGERVPYEETLEHLATLVDGVVDGAYFSLWIGGRGGTGKTQVVEQALHDAGLSDGNGYFLNTGSASASGIYLLLYHHRNDIVVFDDSDGALKDQDARNLLKAATDTKQVRKLVWTKNSSFLFDPDTDDENAYKADKNMAPNQYVFKGKIIFISNLPLKQLDPDGALRTRGPVVGVDPTDDEMYSYMEKILDKINLEQGRTLPFETRLHVLEVVKRQSSRKDRPSLRKLVRGLNMAAAGLKNWERLIELYA